MTLHLTPEQAYVWQRGWWDAYRVEEDILELVDRRRIREEVVVLLPDNRVAFALTPARMPERRHHA